MTTRSPSPDTVIVDDLSGETTYQASVGNVAGLDRWEQYQHCFQDFAREIKSNVKVYNLRGQPTPLVEEHDGWIVNVWSVPLTGFNNGHGPTEYRNRLWDHNLGAYAEYSYNLSDGYENFSDCIPVFSDNDEFVAAIYPEHKNIYISFELTRAGRMAEVVIPLCVKVLGKVASIINLENIDEYMATLAAERSERARKQFVELLSRRRELRIQEAESNLNAIESYLRDIGAQIQRHIRDREVAMAALKIAKANRTKNDLVEKEWDLILSHEHVDYLDISGEEFIVNTKVLISKQLPDTSCRRLGKFAIHFYPQDNRMPRVFCLDQHPFNGWEHPHIPSSGEVCWGNMAESVATFISKYEFGIATQIIIRFLLEPWEDEAWGSKIWNWPVESIDEGKEPWTPDTFCLDCGNPIEECECDYCDYCGRGNECECGFCQHCGERYQDGRTGETVNDCACPRCEGCGAPVRQCFEYEYCERCEYCEALIDDCVCRCACGEGCDNRKVEGQAYCQDCIDAGCNA